MLTAYISGIAATLTPCTIVLIPIFLYRFGIWGGRKGGRLYKDMAYTFLGYILGLLLVGLVLDSITQSDFYNAARIIIGVGFIIIGVLQVFGRFNVILLQNISNSFMLGFVLPWALTVSPCVLPIFSSFLASELSKGEIYLKLIIFGAGLLTPAVMVGILGSKVFSIMKKTSVIFAQVEKFSGIIMIGAGVYMNFQILEVRNLELVLSSLFLIMIIAGTAFYLVRSKVGLSLSRLIILFSIAFIWFIFTFSCYGSKNHIAATVESHEGLYQCAQEERCERCTECALRFSFAAGLGGLGFVLAVAEDRKMIKLPKIKIKIS